MCHIGVVGHSIHPPLCAVTEETIHNCMVYRGVGGKVMFTTMGGHRGMGVMLRMVRQRTDAVQLLIHKDGPQTRVGVLW